MAERTEWTTKHRPIPRTRSPPPSRRNDRHTRGGPTAPHFSHSSSPATGRAFSCGPAEVPHVGEFVTTSEGEHGRDRFEPAGVERAPLRFDPSPLSWMSLMNPSLLSVPAIAAAPSVVPAVSAPDAGLALFAAARLVLADLERGCTIDAQALRTAMIAAF